jgi:hypothetical protein
MFHRILFLIAGLISQYWHLAVTENNGQMEFSLLLPNYNSWLFLYFKTNLSLHFLKTKENKILKEKWLSWIKNLNPFILKTAGIFQYLHGINAFANQYVN